MEKRKEKRRPPLAAGELPAHEGGEVGLGEEGGGVAAAEEEGEAVAVEVVEA